MSEDSVKSECCVCQRQAWIWSDRFQQAFCNDVKCYAEHTDRVFEDCHGDAYAEQTEE